MDRGQYSLEVLGLLSAFPVAGVRVEGSETDFSALVFRRWREVLSAVVD